MKFVPAIRTRLHGLAGVFLILGVASVYISKDYLPVGMLNVVWLIIRHSLYVSLCH